MGPIDPDGSGDTKAIVAASPSSGSSSLNVAVQPDEMATTTITITGVDGAHANNGAAAAPSAPIGQAAVLTSPVTTANVATAPTSGYSSVYMNNRNYNILLGGKPSRLGIPPFALAKLFPQATW